MSKQSLNGNKSQDDTKLGLGDTLIVGFFDGCSAFIIILGAGAIGQMAFQKTANDAFILILATVGFLIGSLIVGRKTPEFPRFHLTIEKYAAAIYIFVFLLAIMSFMLGVRG
jgi:hypothetical protein